MATLVEWNDLIEAVNQLPVRFILRQLNIPYKRESGDTQCKCPLHGDDTHPSARIYEDTNMFKCYACDVVKSNLGLYCAVEATSISQGILDLVTLFKTDLIKMGYDWATTLTQEDITYARIHRKRSKGGFGVVTSEETTVLEPAATTPTARELKAFRTRIRPLWWALKEHPRFREFYSAFDQDLNHPATSTRTLDRWFQFLQKQFQDTLPVTCEKTVH